MARTTPPRDVIGALTRSTRFRTLVTLLGASQLDGDLRAPGPWLLLAPADDAFDALPRGLLRALFAPSGIESLVDLAENHVARTVLPRSGGTVATLLGRRVSLQREGPIASGGARILSWRTFDRGVIAVVDRVLLPPSIRSAVPAAGPPLPARRERRDIDREAPGP